jgi:hypothetical protein
LGPEPRHQTNIYVVHTKRLFPVRHELFSENNILSGFKIDARFSITEFFNGFTEKLAMMTTF